MKLLFLDVDGVLNSKHTSSFKDSLWPIDPYMSFLVGKIQLDTGCAIVLSSAWRYHPDGLQSIRNIVDVVDVTPKNMKIVSETTERGEEIQAWLDKHPEVETYAILDDDNDMLPQQLPNFFQTSFETGITEEIAKAVIAHLNA